MNQVASDDIPLPPSKKSKKKKRRDNISKIERGLGGSYITLGWKMNDLH